jgi:serine/threonine protein kinase
MTTQYLLLKQIGKGQFGTVFLANHAYLPRQVALKIIPLDAISSPRELLSEASKLAALGEQDNVVRVYDAGEWDAQHVYIAYELCPNGSLEEKTASPIDPATACSLISTVCRGLDHVHSQGLLHLDIRPANILLDGADRPKLVDFGLARWTHDAKVDTWYWPHAAPELVEFGTADIRTDVYGMAMTLAHLLTAGTICRPFPTGAALVQASSDGTWPRLDALPASVPSRLRKLLAAATSYRPDERPDSIERFKRLLDRAVPAVAFVAVSADEFVSHDGSWTITTINGKGGYSVQVNKNGRRTALRADAPLTLKQAAQHVERVIRKLAYG